MALNLHPSVQGSYTYAQHYLNKVEADIFNDDAMGAIENLSIAVTNINEVIQAIAFSEKERLEAREKE